MQKIISFIKSLIYKNQYISKNDSGTSINGKVFFQLIASVSFFILSITNIVEKSYIMLIYTTIGFALNLLFALISFRTKNEKICSYTSIIICASIFSLFVIVGGNDGFASLWIVLMPVFAMAIMDFLVGFIMSIVLELFLIVVLWTPLNGHLLYSYNEQFCLRFPILFFVSFLMGLVTTVILMNSKYKAQVHLFELQKVTEMANRLAKYDSLTGLANRRCVYEIFDKEYKDEKVPHCIVMGDVDHFKSINDTFGHEFGDEVLVNVSKYITEILPENYIKSRWGGEEFLIAANEPIERVFEQIEILRKKISEHQYSYNGETFNVTITFGIAEYYKAEDLNDAINTADGRLYKGKKTARNSTIIQ